VADFARDASKPSGRTSICKPCDREKARRYYQENRDAKLARAAARRPERRCEECGDPVPAGHLVTCGASRCREDRYRRLHPAEYAAREKRKVERRREARRQAREAGGS
jgi:hypothetical protein